MLKSPRILFFSASAVPTGEEQLEAELYGPNTSFRNASLVTPQDGIEPCDGVAGKVPEHYAAKKPHARDALLQFQNERAAKKAEWEAKMAKEQPSVGTTEVPPAPPAPPAAPGSNNGWTANPPK